MASQVDNEVPEVPKAAPEQAPQVVLSPEELNTPNPMQESQLVSGEKLLEVAPQTEVAPAESEPEPEVHTPTLSEVLASGLLHLKGIDKQRVIPADHSLAPVIQSVSKQAETLQDMDLKARRKRLLQPIYLEGVSGVDNQVM